MTTPEMKPLLNCPLCGKGANERSRYAYPGMPAQTWLHYCDSCRAYTTPSATRHAPNPSSEYVKAVEALANNVQLYFDQMAYEERGDNVCERDLRQALAAYRAQVTKEGKP